jgi:hypothetical protein
MARRNTNIQLKGDAKKKGAGVILTSGLHSDGELVILSPMTFFDASWVCSFVIKITDSEGISDVDGTGGDGIRFKLCSQDKQELFAVSLDTFKNLENNSGNEVVVYFEGTKVAQAACNERFNDGKEKNVEIVYDHELETVVVRVNDMSIVAYAFHEVPFYELVSQPVMLCFSSFTGDAGGTHMVSDVKFALNP